MKKEYVPVISLQGPHGLDGHIRYVFLPTYSSFATDLCGMTVYTHNGNGTYYSTSITYVTPTYLKIAHINSSTQAKHYVNSSIYLVKEQIPWGMYECHLLQLPVMYNGLLIGHIQELLTTQSGDLMLVVTKLEQELHILVSSTRLRKNYIQVSNYL